MTVVPTDIDAVMMHHIEATLGAVQAITDLIGFNSLTALPQVYWSFAPAGTLGRQSDFDDPPPYIIYRAQDNGGQELDQMDSLEPRVWATGLWAVRIDGLLSSKETIETLAALVYQTLHGSTAIYSYPDRDYRIVTTEQVQRINLDPELIDDQMYMYRGGIYAITAQPL